MKFQALEGLNFQDLEGLKFQNKQMQKQMTQTFLVKNGNFKTWDFSPLIERVLVGVDKSLTKEGNESNFHKRTKLKAFSYLFCPTYT